MTTAPYRSIGFRRRFLVATFALLVPALACPPSVAADKAGADKAEWKQACRDIIAGNIDAGAQALRSKTADDLDDPDLLQIRKWLDDYDKLQAQRDKFRQADHDYELALAEAYAKKNEWLAAMRHVVGAYDTAKAPDAFMKSEATTRLVKDAVAKVEELYRRGEWADAAGIYACLEHIHKDDKEYEKMKRRSLRHARLELVYKKDNRDRWERDLRQIERSMVRDAFLQVGRHYVRDADFRKALAGGIENLQILAKTTNLGSVFEGLSDRDAVVRFTGEITTILHQVNRRDRVDASTAYEQFERILKSNSNTIKLPEELIINEFMEGALSPLDRFSSMIWPSDVAEFKKHTMGRFQGVGIQIRKRQDGKLMVVSPLPGTPAHRAGIMPGDLILKVDGDSIEGLEIDEIVPKIMGRKGTIVELTIQRGKGAPFVVPIERDNIIIRSIRGIQRKANGKWDYLIDPEQRIGYIRIDPSFMDDTVNELKTAVNTLQAQGVRALILDLRFNPGGLLRTAIEVTDLFLPAGKGIVSTRGQHSDIWARGSETAALFDKDMILLVNETSASASEILAGALQDHHRAIVLGERTHGKGSVQNLIPIAADAAYLKLTTALYYLPSDRCPDKRPDAEEWGVMPDITVDLRPEERAKVIVMRRDSDILGEKAEDTSTKPAKKEPTTQMVTDVPEPTPIEDRPDVDPQLEAALLILKVKLLSGQPWVWSGQTVAKTTPESPALP